MILKLGQPLYTRDGRVVGNAIITNVSSDGYCDIETDFGNTARRLSVQEVTDRWHLTDADGNVCVSELSRWRTDRRGLPNGEFQ